MSLLAGRSAVAAALGGVFQQFDADLGPHEAGESAVLGDADEVVAPDDAVAPAKAPAAVTAARAGNGLMIEKDRAQGIDRPRGTTEPLQLGEPLPHGVDERALDVGAPGQPFHGPGRQGGLRPRRTGRRHDRLTPVSRKAGHRASETSASNRSRNCSSVSVGASSASVITCRSAWRSRPISSTAAARSARCAERKRGLTTLITQFRPHVVHDYVWIVGAVPVVRSTPVMAPHPGHDSAMPGSSRQGS